MQISSAGIRGHEYKAEYLKVKSGADLIAVAGHSASATERALRRFSSEEILHHRDMRGNGANAHRMYAPSDIAIGAILVRITSDFGVQDRDALRLIAEELYRPESGGIHAITRALAAVREGHKRICHIAIFRESEDQRRFRVRLTADEQVTWDETPRGSLIIDLGSEEEGLLSGLIEWLGAEELSPAQLHSPNMGGD